MGKKELTKNNYLDAFWQLYQTKPIQNITIGELSALAGYNRSTFYEYFTDIYDVLDQLEQNVIQIFLDSLNEYVVFHKKIDELHMMIVDGFPNAYFSCEKYLDYLLGENGDPTFAGKLYQGTMDNFREALSEHDAKYQYIMEYGYFAIMSILPRWNKGGRPVPLDQLMESILAAIHAGIRFLPS